MSSFLNPLKKGLFASPVLEQQSRPQNGLPPNASSLSLPMTEQSVAGSNRQSRHLSKANFDDALRIRTVSLTFLHNIDSTDRKK
jgi:hypothetical protein